MKGSIAVSSRDACSTSQPPNVPSKRTTSSSPRGDAPLLSPSTASFQSSSTATARSRVHRTLSRPKWLDVDVNGGLLKRKTEPAVAAVTVKGADSIGINRWEAVNVANGEDGSKKGKGKPQMRKAVTLDTISTPHSTALPSPRRRVSHNPLSAPVDTAMSDVRLLEDEQEALVHSPGREDSRLISTADEDKNGGSSSTGKQINSGSDKSGAESGSGMPLETQRSLYAAKETIPSSEEPNSKTTPRDTNPCEPATNMEEPSTSHVDNASQAQGSAIDHSSQPAQDSRLWTWGKWAYTYVPAVRRPAIAPSAMPETADVAAQSESSVAPRDFEQLEETGMNEAIGSLPPSEAKDLMYNCDPADEALGIETEQGIGVDPVHRSEVPVSSDRRANPGSGGTWSLTELALSAWNWRKAGDTVSAGGPEVKNPANTTDPAVADAVAPATADIPAAPPAEQRSEPSESAMDRNSAAGTEAPTDTRVRESDNETKVASGTAPGWSGYMGSWIRAPTASLKPISDLAGDAGDGKPDEASTQAADVQPNADSLTTNVSEPPSSASTAGLSTIDAINNAYQLQQTADSNHLSRTAWAFTVAGRWLPRRQSYIDAAGPSKQKTEATVGDPELAKVLDEAAVRPNASNTLHVDNGANDQPQSQRSAVPLTATQTAVLTPEALEARQSPLLPSSASAVVTTRPNLVLPSFNHTFRRPPRGNHEHSSPESVVKQEETGKSEKVPQILHPRPHSPPSMAWRALGAVSHYARGSSKDNSPASSAYNTDNRPSTDPEKTMLPIVTSSGKDQWKGVRRIVIIGVHGWFPNAHVQKVIGAPRGSSYFASMMGQAVLAQFEADYGVGQEAPEKVTYIPLDGEGTVEVRVEKLFKAYLSRADWIRDVRRADAIFVAAHSQGTIVATHLLSRLISQGHVRTAQNAEAVNRCEWAFGPVVQPGNTRPAKSHASSGNRYPRVGLLAMCGVHQGPFYSSTTSTVLQPYLNWFENAAARELFDFQDSQSVVVTEYKKALDTILHHGVKTIFLASLDDQMVPIYSATFAAASHPLILRLLYVDAAIHSSTDFMINLIVFCLMLRNAGLDDQGLIGHLSEATAGAWRGAGHSTPYEDPGAYAFMVKYLLSTDCPADAAFPELKVEDFAVRDAKNDYELPWILRGVMDDPAVKILFDAEITELKENILSWNPTTRALKDMKKRLEPMAGRAALRQHQQKERLQRSSSFLSLASSDGQARRQDEISSSPRGEGIQKKGLASSTVMNADW